MSVHCLIGVPGAGKSYEAVQRARDAVAIGRCVVTNLPLKLSHPFWEKALADKLLFMVGSTSKIDPDDLTNHFGHMAAWQPIIDKKNKVFHRTLLGKTKSGESAVSGPLVIVDESSITFEDMIDSKRKNDDFKNLMKFFKVHRHSLIDILLLYHEHGQMDPKIKQVTERYHHVLNTTELRGYNSYRVGISMKGFGSKNSFLSEKTHRFTSKIFDLYDSYAEGDGKGIEGKKSDAGLSRAKPIWLRPWFLIVVFLGFVLLPVIGLRLIKQSKGLLTPEIERSVASPETVITKSGAPVLPLNPVERVIENPITAALGWPDTSSAFIGFDNENIYFGDGVRLNMQSDMTPSGFTVLEILLCRIVMARTVERDGLPVVEVLEYNCVKGN